MPQVAKAIILAQFKSMLENMATNIFMLYLSFRYTRHVSIDQKYEFCTQLFTLWRQNADHSLAYIESNIPLQRKPLSMTSNYTFGLLEGENNLTHQEAVSTHVYPILWPFQRAQAIRGQMVSTETPFDRFRGKFPQTILLWNKHISVFDCLKLAAGKYKPHCILRSLWLVDM